MIISFDSVFQHFLSFFFHTIPNNEKTNFENFSTTKPFPHNFLWNFVEEKRLSIILHHFSVFFCRCFLRWKCSQKHIVSALCLMLFRFPFSYRLWFLCFPLCHFSKRTSSYKSTKRNVFFKNHNFSKSFIDIALVAFHHSVTEFERKVIFVHI